MYCIIRHSCWLSRTNTLLVQLGTNQEKSLASALVPSLRCSGCYKHRNNRCMIQIFILFLFEFEDVCLLWIYTDFNVEDLIFHSVRLGKI